MSESERNRSDFALAFETSSAMGSVALGREERVLAAVRLTQPRAHAAEFLPAIDALCRGNGVEPKSIRAAYVSSGPGSFTGLRIGITAARMIAFATGAKLVAIPTLEIIAQNAADADPRPQRVTVLLDAKRGHVYSAAFDFDGERYRASSSPVEADPLAFLNLQPADAAVLGEGVLYHRDAVAASGRRVLPESLFPPRAETVYRLGCESARRGEFVNARELIPVYIRPPEAEEVWTQRHPSPHA